jgi:hypothetical protein
MAGRDGGEPPCEVEPVGGLVEQPHESPPDVAEADESENELGRPHPLDPTE